jgi:hypothetical protein
LAVLLFVFLEETEPPFAVEVEFPPVAFPPLALLVLPALLVPPVLVLLLVLLDALLEFAPLFPPAGGVGVLLWHCQVIPSAV